MRHENTIPKAVNDRIELLEKTELNVSPTHGLYTDKNYELEKYMDEAITNPLFDTEDYQGVRDVLAVIHDAQVIRKFVDIICREKDHPRRWTSSLRRISHLQEPEVTQPLTHRAGRLQLPHDVPDQHRSRRLRGILPTHWLINGIENFDEFLFTKRLDEFFTVKPVRRRHIRSTKLSLARHGHSEYCLKTQRTRSN